MIGLIFFYVVLSLFASSVQEWIASLFALRSKNLQAGIKKLLGDKYAKLVYDHPLIKNLSKDRKLPSYIAPETLSTVVLSVLDQVRGDNARKEPPIGASGETGSEEPEQDKLQDIIDSLTPKTKVDSSNDILKHNLTNWFDEGMTRISGWYKRQTKWIIVAIALVVTVATNANTFHMAGELWENDSLRAQVAAHAELAAQSENVEEVNETEMKGLETLPIGWKKKNQPDCFVDWINLVFGWLITIAAISLGAPFWFDLLGKVANLKGSGGKSSVESKSTGR